MVVDELIATVHILNCFLDAGKVGTEYYEGQKGENERDNSDYYWYCSILFENKSMLLVLLRGESHVDSKSHEGQEWQGK